MRFASSTRGGRAFLVVWSDDEVAVAITANLMGPLDHDPDHNPAHRMARLRLER